MSQKKETTVLLLTLLITSSAIGGGLWWLTKDKQFSNPTKTIESANQTQSIKSTFDREQISTGDKLLISQDTTPQKQKAVQAIANADYPQAVSQLEQSLKVKRNDPEALIYLNNARIGNNKAYSIAVPVPVGTEMTTAKEILRGVAQAQDEINQQGGINGVPLKIIIANDDDNPESAEQVAQNLVKSKDILGVVGHFSSGVSLAAAPIYQKNGLVAISPTSTSVALSDMGNYIFRTVPSDRFSSNSLSRYMLEKLNQSKAAVIYNSQSAYSRSLRDAFTTNAVGDGGEIVTETDLSQGNFNPVETLQSAISNGAEVLVFLNDSTTLDEAFLLMQLNNRQLPMLAGDSFYKPQTLQILGKKAEGLVVSVPWHILVDNNSNFPDAASRLWGGDVSWRTAMAYDATKALAAGLTKSPSRQGIQQTLSQSEFSFNGASGKVRFLPSGDRNSAVQLVKVQPGNRSSYGYDFVPVD